MRIDWGDGDYSRTSEVLGPAADMLLDAARVAVGHRVLDVACGTGNVTLAAAGRGAVATGIDAAPRLVEEAQRRADAAGLAASFIAGEAERLPVADGAFDAALSVFGVIFAQPEPAVAEMLRVTGEDGVVGLTTWRDEGALADATRLLADLMPREDEPARWGDLEWVYRLLCSAGAREVTFRDGTVTFGAASPEGWFAEQEEHHPVWRAIRRETSGAEWARVRREAVAALDAGNEDPAAFRVSSPYLIVLARR